MRVNFFGLAHKRVRFYRAIIYMRHHSRRHRRSRSRSRKHHTRRHRRHRRGGAGAPAPSSYSSAASWGAAVNGSGDSQYGRVFNQNSPFPPNGNAIIGAQGQRAGGRHRRHRRHRGGFMTGMLSKAIVPLGLIGLQQYFSRRHKK